MNNEVNKRLVLIMRVLLAAWGIITGWSFADFLFSRYPDALSNAFMLLIKIINALLFAVVFSTLARIVAAFAQGVARKIKKIISDKPLYVTGSVVLGLVIGAMIGVLANAIVSLFTSIFWARLLLAFVASVTGAYLGFLVCCKTLSEKGTDDEENAVIEYSGYVLSYGAFLSERLLRAAELMNGSVYVLKETLYRVMTEGDGEVKERYAALTELLHVKIVEHSVGETEVERITSFAASRFLKIVTGTLEEIPNAEAKVLPLSEL